MNKTKPSGRMLSESTVQDMNFVHGAMKIHSREYFIVTGQNEDDFKKKLNF